MEAVCESSSLCGARSISSYLARRALDLVCLALALDFIHSSSFSSVFCSRVSLLRSTLAFSAFCSSHMP